MKKHLCKLAFLMALSAGWAMAQVSPTMPQTTPPTFPGHQTPSPNDVPTGQTPEQNSTLGQTGTTNTTAITQAQAHIQSALRQQLPASADSVSVGLSDDSKIELKGVVSSDQEKQRIEQVARAAAPDQTIVNSIRVTSPGESTPPSTSGSIAGNSAAASTSAIGSSAAMGSSAMSSSGQMGAAASSSPQNPSYPSPSSNGQATSGQTTSGSQSTPTTSTGVGAGANGDVQSKIQSALQQAPTLSGANVSVNADDKKVELTGTVATKEQKQTAKSIAEANAGGLKVVDHIKVQGDKDKDQNKDKDKSSSRPY